MTLLKPEYRRLDINFIVAARQHCTICGKWKLNMLITRMDDRFPRAVCKDCLRRMNEVNLLRARREAGDLSVKWEGKRWYVKKGKWDE
jgi:hypothetical protein